MKWSSSRRIDPNFPRSFSTRVPFNPVLYPNSIYPPNIPTYLPTYLPTDSRAPSVTASRVCLFKAHRRVYNLIRRRTANRMINTSQAESSRNSKGLGEFLSRVRACVRACLNLHGRNCTSSFKNAATGLDGEVVSRSRRSG